MFNYLLKLTKMKKHKLIAMILAAGALSFGSCEKFETKQLQKEFVGSHAVYHMDDTMVESSGVEQSILGEVTMVVTTDYISIERNGSIIAEGAYTFTGSHEFVWQNSTYSIYENKGEYSIKAVDKNHVGIFWLLTKKRS